MKTKYKFLKLDGKKIKSANGDCTWKLGEWKKEDGELDLCRNGFHCSDKVYEAFGYVQGEILAKVEVKGEHLDDNDKSVWSDMRIVKAWKWQKKDSVELAIYAAQLVIDIYEKKYPNDDRPRKAIEAAIEYVKNPNKKNMAAADAARAAAGAAARAARAADAARAAADAARAAAGAAYAAAYAARAAADAARAAAGAAYAAAYAAARAAADAALIIKIDKFMVNRIKNLEEIK
jgi:hypothetical protein